MLKLIIESIYTIFETDSFLLKHSFKVGAERNAGNGSDRLVVPVDAALRSIPRRLPSRHPHFPSDRELPGPRRPPVPMPGLLISTTLYTP